MRTIILIPLLLTTSIIARDNPFFPASLQSQTTSNIPDTTPKLGTYSIPLPDQSRILKEITVTLQNADGSIETKTYTIERSLDWHKQLLVTQGGSSKPAEQPMPTGSARSADFGFVNAAVFQNKLVLKSSSTILRHFILTDPNRIIIDIDYKGVFDTSEKILNQKVFRTLAVGHHGKFARLTVTLDGRYHYKIEKKSNEAIITCE